jgi:hypothetical protein
MDIFYARGSMDYRVRWPEVFAGLDRLRIHDAPLMGEFHVGIPAWQAGGGYWLAGDFVSRGIPWREMPCYDVLLLSGIPHCALGAENAYAMVDYVKAGGGVLFTGGEYAFGKGGYDFTVLERELLPVLCAKTVDTVYPPVPLAIEPGKDLAELGVKLDLAARPAVWVYNAVALKEDPGVKVFLKTGNVPLLVGRQLGKGRVACLLADHRGQSADGVTAWFDWAGWPDLARAVLAWLAPDAYRRDPVETKRLGADDLARLAAKLRAASVDDVVGRLIDEKETRPQVLAEPGAAVELKPAELTERLATLEEALRGSGPELAALLAEQLAAVPNLPDAMRGRLVDFVRRQPPAGLAAVASRCLKAKEPAIRQNGYELLAIAGAPEFPAVLASSPDAMETDPVTRDRCLALGVAMYPKADLCDDGRKRLAAWNAQEADACAAYTGGKPWSLESPEVPCLDSETLFRRAAWLAYLSRHDPKTYGAQFAREWLMTAEYEDYCARTARSLWSDNMTPAEVKRAKFQGELWDKFAALFARLRGLTQDDAERLLKDHPDLAAAGFKQAAFLREGRECINLLGVQPVADTRPTLESLSGARCPLLADFARARLKGAKSP